MMLLKNNLLSFKSVAEEGTVIGAARKLGLTQTGVTQRIKSLEIEIGVSLFIRSRKGMILTKEGESLLNYCKQCIEIEGQVMSQISGAGLNTDITLNLVGPTSLLSGRIVHQLVPIYRKWPRLRLNLYIDDSEDRLHMIKKGSADLAILRPNDVVNELTGKKLNPVQFMLVGHPKWKGRPLKEIISHERIIDFHEQDSTTWDYLRQYKLEKFVDRPRIYVNENQALISMFCSGLGYGTLAKEIAEMHIAQGSLISLNESKLFKEAVALAWYPRAEMPKYFSELINSIS